jgi:nucleoid-associated protein YgaU
MSIDNLNGNAGNASAGTRSPQKVLIKHETDRPKLYSGLIRALFNPNELRYQKDATWDIDPATGQALIATTRQSRFNVSKPPTLSIDLFFDTYEGPPQASGRAIAGSQVPSAVDVTTFTKQVANLASVFPELHRPPRCQLWWGQYCLIRGVLTSLTERYTFFLADGTPVRAVLSCTFTEALDEDALALIGELHSSDVDKQRVVRRGDTLSSIALEVHGDASQWRAIAAANNIDDPRQQGVTPGRVLRIPSNRTRR